MVTDYVIKQQSIQEAMAPEMTSGVSRVVQEHGTFAPPNVIDAMTPGDAQAYLEFVKKNTSIVSNIITGESVRVDIKTGKTQTINTTPELDAELGRLSTPTPREGRTLYDLVDITTTGIAAGATEQLQRYTGQFPGFQFNVQNRADFESRQALDLAPKS